MAARILVIEDNEHTLDLVCYLLEVHGYSPTVAMDGEEGLSAARSAKFELIVCDLQLPKTDGYQIAAELKSDPQLSKIPLIAVTALAMVGDREKALAAGFDDYISKPIDPQTFVPQLEALLEPEDRAKKPIAGAEPSKTEDSKPLGKSYTILVVDDIPVQLDLARSLLEHFGFCVFTAEGLDSALSLVRQFQFDLIMSDVNMSDSSGYDFLELVKKDPELNSIPFILITSTYNSERHREKGLSLGAAKYIVRPIEPQQLVAEIMSCFDQ